MNKKGFTLIEILAVLVIMSIISIVAIASTGAIQKNIKRKEYNTKIEMLESAALDYAEGKFNEVKSSGDHYKSKACITVSIEDLLLGGYLQQDNTNVTSASCLNGDGSVKSKCAISDPRYDDDSYMNGVIVYYDNNRLNAKYIKNPTNEECK